MKYFQGKPIFSVKVFIMDLKFPGLKSRLQYRTTSPVKLETDSLKPISNDRKNESFSVKINS